MPFGSLAWEKKKKTRQKLGLCTASLPRIPPSPRTVNEIVVQNGEMKWKCSVQEASPTFQSLFAFLEKGCLGAVCFFIFYKWNLSLSPSVCCSCFPKLKLSSLEGSTLALPSVWEKEVFICTDTNLCPWIHSACIIPSSLTLKCKGDACMYCKVDNASEQNGSII